jgi:hypothetical protein
MYDQSLAGILPTHIDQTSSVFRLNMLTHLARGQILVGTRDIPLVSGQVLVEAWDVPLVSGHLPSREIGMRLTVEPNLEGRTHTTGHLAITAPVQS